VFDSIGEDTRRYKRSYFYDASRWCI